MMLKKALCLALTSAFASHASAATIVINPGTGFGDTTPSNTIPDQKGNNSGNTLGEMRLILFQEAASVWGDILNSSVTITVDALFADLACFGSSAQLGHAGPTSTNEDFGAGDANIAYAIALAESLSSSNQNGATAEITATFNAKVDSDPGCLGASFYYGLDDNAPVGTTALFPVVLHELGHGLGFLSYVKADGGWLNGTMDPYSRLLMDLESGKSWATMSNLERSNSLLNEPNLVWTGVKVTADRALHLDPAPELKINTPGTPRVFDAAIGQQSATIPSGGLTGGVLDGDTFQADPCNQNIGNSDYDGKIVLYDDAACSAAFLAVVSEFRGATGVVVVATMDNGLPDMSGLMDNEISIPYIGVAKSAGIDLRSDLGAVNVTIQKSASKLNGDNQGKVKMYAPTLYSGGSSVSHWSMTATPDLLMEPSQGTLIFKNVDLTAAAFQDIGWSVNIPGGVVELIYKDGFEN